MAQVSFGSGRAFVPQVADFLDNVGADPAIAVTSDGVPFIAYFGFPEEPAEGQVPIQRPIGAPSVPGVLLASLEGGVWTRGAVAIAEEIANVDVPFAPAFGSGVTGLSPGSARGLAMAADGEGKLHVVWGDINGLWYATNAGGGFVVQQVTRGGSVSGPSITVDDSGNPWIAYYTRGLEGSTVRAATVESGLWTTITLPGVASVEACATCRTAIGIAAGGSPMVAYTDGGRSVSVAEPEGGALQTVGDGGQGLSMAVDGEGNLHLSYYAGGSVVVARSAGGLWQTTDVADVSSETSSSEGASTSLDVDEEGAIYVAWRDAGSDSVVLASNEGGQFQPIETGDTRDGLSPSLAVTSDGASVFVAWYDSAGQNLAMGTYGDVSGLALANTSPTGEPLAPTTGAPTTGAPTTAPPAACEPDGDTVSVVALGIAFDTDCLAAPADAPFTIVFDNQDAGTAHNVAIYPSPSELTSPLLRGDIFNGVATMEYTGGPLAAGEYYFQCDVHPPQMNGTFVVK
ncbi:MAG: hypothetical protein ACT4PO_15615 [Actinomycetota bacterium]